MYYDKALVINPDDTTALGYRGVALESLGNHTGAIEYYDKALAIEPDDTDALGHKGFALNYLGNYTEAIEYLVNQFGVITKIERLPMFPLGSYYISRYKHFENASVRYFFRF
jgi:tetratricopeptide (TPR) repeat protein